jgi:hypothetical protein
MAKHTLIPAGSARRWLTPMDGNSAILQKYPIHLKTKDGGKNNISPDQKHTGAGMAKK